MRTNIVIDDELLKEAMAATGLCTKRAVVEEALLRLLRANRRLQALEELRGSDPEWSGDVRAWRRGDTPADA